MDNNWLDLVIVHRLAARFSDVAGLYAYALNKDGEILTDITGDPAESSRLLDIVGRDTLENLYHRVSDSDMEIQAIEETAVPNRYLSGS